MKIQIFRKSEIPNLGSAPRLVVEWDLNILGSGALHIFAHAKANFYQANSNFLMEPSLLQRSGTTGHLLLNFSLVAQVFQLKKRSYIYGG